MHNQDDKYSSRPGFEPGTPRLQAPVDMNEPYSLVLANIRNGKQRYWRTYATGNIGTGEHRTGGTYVLGNIGTGTEEQRYWGT